MVGLAWKYLSLGGLSWIKCLIRECSLVLYDSTPCKEQRNPLMFKLVEKKMKIGKMRNLVKRREVMMLSKLLSIHEKKGSIF